MKNSKVSKKQLLDRYCRIRQTSVEIFASLTPEQSRIQPIVEVSPPWWNLAHTSWFFVRQLLQPFGGQQTKEDALFDYILNSYYAGLGPRLERQRRGFLTRPSLEEVLAYRKSVDERVIVLLENLGNESKFGVTDGAGLPSEIAHIITVGLNHEQQHQELFFTEIKYILYQNPLLLRQAYRKRHNYESLLASISTSKPPSFSTGTLLPSFIDNRFQSKFISFDSGLGLLGNQEDWGWDNEFPAHKFYLQDFSIRNTLVTNGEYLEFIEDGGYKDQLLWLDNGWNKVQSEAWDAPLYWEQEDGEWLIWTLNGMQRLALNEPVCHVSFYEADAFARWKGEGIRLPTEQEWEYAARQLESDKIVSSNKVSSHYFNLLESDNLHPKSLILSEVKDYDQLYQMLGDVWEWTNSYYQPYPGYKPFEGSLKEYNQKFMDNQRVLRGGSCVTPRDHIRVSYRNFWAPETRFQFSGIRLARTG